ncbi:MAG: HAMP domain-containing histidine kinase [Oscillospiraceae bacterium]|nr:HAMP domain-containing histidine kinase [Oscillospiraceae bacterium]
MVYALCALCALLGLAVLLLVWKIVLLRLSAEELRQGLQERLETDTNTLLSISSRDGAMCRLAAALNVQLRQLRRERRQHQNGDRDLKEAVTNIAHDLRTPLTAICGYLDLLEGEEKSRAAERYLELIRGRTGHLKDLTEEFFRYSAVLSADEEDKRETVSLNRAVEESLAAWYGVLSAKGIAPEVDIPEVPVTRRLNREALSRVLGNVLSNAAKYSPGDLRVILTEDGALTFSNAAPALTPVLAEKLFDRYFTVESGGQGAGLGLSIARHLTERMGGTVSADWRAGILTVCLRFPEQQPGAASSAGHSATTAPTT